MNEKKVVRLCVELIKLMNEEKYDEVRMFIDKKDQQVGFFKLGDLIECVKLT